MALPISTIGKTVTGNHKQGLDAIDLEAMRQGDAIRNARANRCQLHRDPRKMTTKHAASMR